jgi:hypothetical protein
VVAHQALAADLAASAQGAAWKPGPKIALGVPGRPSIALELPQSFQDQMAASMQTPMPAVRYVPTLVGASAGGYFGYRKGGAGMGIAGALIGAAGAYLVAGVVFPR